MSYCVAVGDRGSVKGNYFGTVRDGKWWRRYYARGFFARGNGELELNDEGIKFTRTLTRNPLTIRWDEAHHAALGQAHAGRSGLGRPILKIDFERAGATGLSAGFFLSADWDEMERFVGFLNRRIAGQEDGSLT